MDTIKNILQRCMDKMWPACYEHKTPQQVFIWRHFIQCIHLYNGHLKISIIVTFQQQNTQRRDEMIKKDEITKSH